MKEVVNNDRTIKSNRLGLQDTVDRGVVYLCIQATLRFIKINFLFIIQHFLLKVKFTVDRGVVYLCIQEPLRFIKINFHSSYSASS